MDMNSAQKEEDKDATNQIFHLSHWQQCWIVDNSQHVHCTNPYPYFDGEYSIFTKGQGLSTNKRNNLTTVTRMTVKHMNMHHLWLRPGGLGRIFASAMMSCTAIWSLLWLCTDSDIQLLQRTFVQQQYIWVQTNTFFEQEQRRCAHEQGGFVGDGRMNMKLQKGMLSQWKTMLLNKGWK